MLVMTLFVAEWKEPSLVAPAQEHESAIRMSNKMREKESWRDRRDEVPYKSATG